VRTCGVGIVQLFGCDDVFEKVSAIGVHFGRQASRVAGRHLLDARERILRAWQGAHKRDLGAEDRAILQAQECRLRLVDLGPLARFLLVHERKRTRRLSGVIARSPKRGERHVQMKAR
jgi:hypothetical protein